MKEITLKLYSFSELEESVRKEIVERERWNVMGNSMEAWSSDWQNSLSEFEKMTDTNVRGWQVDYCTYHFGSVRYKHDGPVLGDYENGYYAHELKGKHLFRYLNRYILPYVEKKKTYWGQFKYDENGKCIGHKKRVSHIIDENDNLAEYGRKGHDAYGLRHGKRFKNLPAFYICHKEKAFHA